MIDKMTIELKSVANHRNENHKIIGKMFFKNIAFLNFVEFKHHYENLSDIRIDVNPSKRPDGTNISWVSKAGFHKTLIQVRDILAENHIFIEDICCARIRYIELRHDIALDEPYPFYARLFEHLNPKGVKRDGRIVDSWFYGSRGYKQLKVYDKEKEVNRKRNKPTTPVSPNLTRIELKLARPNVVDSFFSEHVSGPYFTIDDLINNWNTINNRFIDYCLDKYLSREFPDFAVPTSDKIEKLVLASGYKENNQYIEEFLKMLGSFYINILGPEAVFTAFKKRFDARNTRSLRNAYDDRQSVIVSLGLNELGFRSLRDQLNEIREKLKLFLLPEEKIATLDVSNHPDYKLENGEINNGF